MKRLSLFIALCLFMFTGAYANANIYDLPGAYKIKFDGFEYAYFGSHADFMSGDIASGNMVSSLSQLVKPDMSLSTGFNLTALIYTTQVNTVQPGGIVDNPPVYGTGSAGVYLGILRDIEVFSTQGSVSLVDSRQSADLFFKGGLVDWYFLPTASASEFSSLSYVAGVGLVSGGSVFNPSVYTPFAEFALSVIDGQTGITGMASVAFKEGRLTGNAEFYADVLGTSWMDTNRFGDGHDLLFQSSLQWFDATKRFTVDDPARVDVVTPEPASMLLLGTGLAGLVAFARRRRNA